MSVTRKRLKKKALQRNLERNLDGIVKGILVEHKGNGKQIVLALITAKKELKDAGATPKELKKFQDKIDEYMALVKKEKKRVEARKRTEQGIEAMANKKYKDPEEDSGGEEEIMLKKPKKRLSVFAALSQGKKVPPPGFAGGRKTRKQIKRRSRKKRSRKKKGGSGCRVFHGNCNDCVGSTHRCVYNKKTKKCSKDTSIKRLNTSWSKKCDIPVVSPDNVVPVVELLREESLGGTPFAGHFQEGSNQVPYPNPVDGGISLEETKRNTMNRRQLRETNGTVNNNSAYQGTPCFTRCEHKGWCESGVKGACDWENYCYPSNNSGNSKMPNVEKQYCDKPVRRARVIGDGRIYLQDDLSGGKKNKSRRRKSKKNRRSKTKRKRKKKKRKTKRRR